MEERKERKMHEEERRENVCGVSLFGRMSEMR